MCFQLKNFLFSLFVSFLKFHFSQNLSREKHSRFFKRLFYIFLNQLNSNVIFFLLCLFVKHVIKTFFIIYKESLKLIIKVCKLFKLYYIFIKFFVRFNLFFIQFTSFVLFNINFIR